MLEMIDIYTKDGEKIGTISKDEYYRKKWDEIPWIRCSTCFVIDRKTNKVLLEKRGKNFLDPGKVDLCSGHIKSDETETQGMLRELNEELNIKPENAYGDIKKIGQILIDYTDLNDETNRKKLKCFVSIFELKLNDISNIKIDNEEAISMAWIDLNEVFELIRTNMTRIPYEGELIKEFETIFKKIQQVKDSKILKGEY